MGIDRKYRTLDDAAKQIPGNEPVFIIRAQDKASIPAIIAYAIKAWEAGAAMEFVHHVIQSAREFEMWQLSNGSKTPD